MCSCYVPIWHQTLFGTNLLVECTQTDVAAMAEAKFFDERTDQSEVKARIVQKYFEAWAKVIIPTAKLHGGKIAYIDLYAGPGRYRDGAASTPLLVLERAIAAPDMSQM